MATYHFTLLNDVIISATEATVATYTVTINQTTGQTITVTCEGEEYTSSFTAAYGSTWTAEIAASDGYTAGTLSATSGTVTGDVTVSATEATVATYTFTITQSSNQTITVTCGGEEYTSTFTATKGDEWTATITPDTGYDAGTLTATSGTITGDTEVSASEASVQIFTVTITQSSNQTITATENGTAHTSTFTAAYGTMVYLSVAADSGYIEGDLSTESSFNVTENITISASDAAAISSITACGTFAAAETALGDDANLLAVFRFNSSSTNKASVSAWMNVEEGSGQYYANEVRYPFFPKYYDLTATNIKAAYKASNASHNMTEGVASVMNFDSCLAYFGTDGLTSKTPGSLCAAYGKGDNTMDETERALSIQGDWLNTAVAYPVANLSAGKKSSSIKKLVSTALTRGNYALAFLDASRCPLVVSETAPSSSTVSYSVIADNAIYTGKSDSIFWCIKALENEVGSSSAGYVVVSLSHQVMKKFLYALNLGRGAHPVVVTQTIDDYVDSIIS